MNFRARSVAANAAVAVALMFALFSIPVISTIGGASASQTDVDEAAEASKQGPQIIVSGDRVAVVGKPYKIEVSVDDIDEKEIASWTVAWGDGTTDTRRNKPGTINHKYDVVGLTQGITVSVTDKDDNTYTNADLFVPNYDSVSSIGRYNAESGAEIADLGESTLSLDSAFASVVGPDGLLYVSGNSSDTIERFDPTDNTYIGTFVPAGSGGLDGPRGLAFGRDGNLYVASSNTGEILRFNGTTGAFIDVFVGSATLNSPSDLLFGPDGNLYVTDRADDVIQRYNGGTGAHRDTFSTLEPGASPSALAWGPNGNLYVALETLGRIDQINGDTGRNLGAFATDGLVAPSGLEIGPDGALWVADYWTDQIHRFNADNGRRLDGGISADDASGPRGFAFSPDHQVSIAEAGKAPTAKKLTLDEWLDADTGIANAPGLSFEKNDGRASDELDFVARGADYDAVLTDGDVVLALGDTPGDSVRMDLQGAAAGRPVKETTALAVEADGPGIEYEDVYTGIDVQYTANGDELEYSFVVAPGADPDTITLDFPDAADVVLDESGDLRITTASGLQLLSTAPLTFQDIAGEQRPIESSYDRRADGSVGFTIAAFDATKPLIIDPTFKSATTASGSSLVLGMPAGVNINDVLLAQVSLASAPTVITPPGGWTLIRVDTSKVTQALYYRVANGTEPANYTWTNSTSTEGSGAILAYSGVDVAAPIAAHGGQSGAAASMVAPSITTTNANTTLIGFFGIKKGGTVAPPGGMTERYDLDGGTKDMMLIEAADQLFVGPGPTGTRTATSETGASDYIAQMIALKSAPLTFTVNSTGNGSDTSAGNGTCNTGGTVGGSPECTLRAAIQEANAWTGTDRIHFNIPTSDAGYTASPVAFRIRPSGSVLPDITGVVTIDGSTQPQFLTAGRPVIVLDGSIAPTDGDPNGLSLNAGNSLIRGLVIRSFGDDGIEVDVAGNNTIVGNFLGTDVTGTLARPNGTNNIAPVGGISLKTDGNTIGGTTAADRNVISGNRQFGIGFRSGSDNNVVIGNYIGTDVTGTLAVANGTEGVNVQSTSTGNRIGGTAANSGNRIAFNTTSGVRIVDTGSANTAIIGNRIHSNGGLGIDVATTGITANNNSDAWVNFPTITSATDVAGTVTVDFDLDVPAGTYRVEAFTNPGGADPSGNGEGQLFQAGTTINHTGSGSEAFQMAFPGSGGDIVSLTATRQTAGPTYTSTSEFSATVTVSAANTAPTLDPVGPQSVDETVLLAFTATASDSDLPADTLTFSLQPGIDAVPAGAAITAGGNFTWTPAETQGGSSYSFKIRVTDDGTGNLFDEEEIVFTINDTNVAPVLAAIGDRTVIETIPLSFTISGTDADNPADTLTYTATGLPTGATLNSSTGTFSWTPTAAQGPGSYPITFTVTDDGTGTLSDSEAITITVNEPNLLVNSTGDASDVTPGDGLCDAGGLNSGGDPECTLRAAIQEANAFAGPNDITFNMPATETGHSGGIWTIAPGSQLPNITQRTTVDATTQSAWTSTPVVELDGTGAGVGSHGLLVAANNSVIRGLAINRFQGDGLQILTGAANTLIESNHIGLDATGLINRGNAGSGIDLQIGSGPTTIGGTLPIERNVISANGDYGIVVSGSNDNLIIGNYIGTDVTGTVDLGNTTDGVAILAGARNNVVGGLTTGERNIISGNNNDGVWITGAGTTGNTVQGNWIGYGSDGSAVGNSFHGIAVENDASNNMIGGDAPAAANRIGNSAWDGVAIASGATSNAILGNSIVSNTGLGIDLENDGLTINDANDVDAGANDLRNFPAITSTSEVAGTVTVDFDLDVPAGDYRIEAFINPSGADPTGYGEGEVFESATTITHTGSGSESFQLTYSGVGGDVITLTTTEDLGGGNYGSTSEFSQAARLATTAVVNSTGDTGDSSPGDGTCNTGGLNSEGDPECTLRAAIEEANASGAVILEFNMPATEAGHATGVWTISPASAFDDIVVPISIDGSTQPGWMSTPVVQLDGTASGASVDGFRLLAGSDGSQIRSLSIGNFDSDAIEIQSDDLVVVGNHLGLDSAGTAATPMATGAGVNVSGALRTRIGGATAADRNVIGNADIGIVVDNASTDTVISGNYIGTDVTGNSSLGAISQYSVYVAGGSTDVTIGGPSTAEGNVIGYRGIYLRDETTGTVLIRNNSIGVGADGTSQLNIFSRAILVTLGADDIEVIDNIIGNAYNAVQISGATTNSRIQGNIIGTDTGLTTDHGTAAEAIVIEGGATGIQIGGTLPSESNRIQFVAFGYHAINVRDAATDDVSILGNEILTDFGAIDLGNDGPTANDPLDTDGGANDLLNYSTIAVTNTTGTGPYTVDLDVTLDAPAGNYRIEVFANTAPGFGGLGRADQLVHAFTVAHTGSGNETFTTSYTDTSFAALSATATEDFGGGLFGSTSEMSPIAPDIGQTVVVNSTGDAGDLDINDGVCLTGGTNSGGNPECTLRAAIEQTNRTTGATVGFAIPTTEPGYDTDGFWTISQSSDLDLLYGPATTIDGSTQPTFDGSRPVIYIEDNAVGSDLMTTRADDITLRSLALGLPGDDAVQIEADRTLLDSLWLGIDPAGADVGGPTNNNEGIVIYDGSTDLVVTDSRVSGFDSAIISNSGTIDATVTNTEIFDNRNGGIVFAHLGRLTSLANSIHDNVGLGIDLGTNDGIPLPNDLGDTDTGGNALLNHPVLTGATVGAGTLDLSYDLDVPAGTYRIEFFNNTLPDPSGNGEGETFVASATFAHAGGSASYLTTIPGIDGDVITATATPDLGGGVYEGTSEFSNSFGIGVVFVNSTADSSDAVVGDGNCDTGALNSDGNTECTLRAAIEEANGNSNIGRIRFMIPETDPGFVAGTPDFWTIAPATFLPAVSDAVEVNASTQPGWAGTPIIELDGSAIVASTDGLTLSDAISVSGFSIVGWSGSGLVTDADNVSVRSNWFGVRPTGAAAPNAVTDLVTFGTADGVVIGGPDSEDTNVFAAGGSTDGLSLTANSSNVTIENNHFGVAGDGTTALTTVAAELLSITDSATNVLVHDNVFGNSPQAAAVVFANATNVTFTANTFGTDRTLTQAFPVGSAIYVNTTGDVRFGGTIPAEWNTVRNASNQGFAVAPTSTGSASYLGNSMHGSTSLGIDLGLDGLTPNDAGDADNGPNDRLNFPDISSSTASLGTVRVAFGLDLPAGTYRIEAFTNPSGAHISGYGEGEVFQTAATVVHAGAGAQSYEITFPGTIGDLVTLTTTEDLGGGNYGATSEFSRTVTTTDPALSLIDDKAIRRSDLLEAGGLSLSLNNVPMGIADGGPGDAVHFDGVNDRLVAPAVDITDSALSLRASINPDTLTGDPRVLSKRTSGGSSIYELFIDSATNEAVAALRIGGANVTARGGAISAGTWHQLDAVWDGSELALFVDGAEVDRVVAAGALASDVATRAIIGNDDATASPFDGLIGDVHISHDVASAASIAASAQNSTAPGFVTVGGEQTSTPGAWTTSSAQTRSGSFALSAPETSGSGAAAWAVATGIDEPGLVFESWWWFSVDSGIDLSSGTRAGTAPTDQYEAALTSPTGWELRQRAGGSGSFDAPAAGSPSAGAWMNVEIRTDQLGDTRLFVDGVEVTTSTPQGSALVSGSMALRAGLLPTGQNWYVDDARGRKLVTPEPVATVGSLDRN